MPIKKTLLVIGNGPSTRELADFGFHNIPGHIDTFGMGLAYKYFDRIGWWPTYYTCADKKVVRSKEDYLKNLIVDEAIKVKKFFFPIKLLEHPKLELIPHGSTGDFAFRKGLELGYEQIFIIGIDLDYKPLREATRISREEFDALDLDLDFHTNVIYRLREPITDHPNYFFPEYQEVGDIYSEPRGNSWHLLTWQRARELAEKNQLPVRNLGKHSLLDIFDRADLKMALDPKTPFPASFPKQSVSRVAGQIFRAEKELADRYLKELGAAREALHATVDVSLVPDVDVISQSLLQISHEAALVASATNDDLDISVVIPCFNSADFIIPCLESLSRQTLPQHRFEVIIVDDCSTDNTVEVIGNIGNLPRNLRIIRHEKNRKQGGARNTGVDNSRGRFLTFLDSDDFLRMDALETLLYATKQGADVSVGQLLKVRYDRDYKPSATNRKIGTSTKVSAIDNTLLGWFPVGMLVSRNLLNENSIRFREGVFFEDIEFSTRLFFCAKKIVVSPEKVYYYIQRDSSTVNSVTADKLTDAVKAMHALYRLCGADPELEDAFVKTASSWLKVQATRIQNLQGDIEDRTSLIDHLITELARKSILAMLGEGFERDLRSRIRSKPVSVDKQEREPGDVRFNPWAKDFKGEFAGKVIFYCEVDYHIRSAAPVARALRERGVESIIVDASRSTSFTTNRPLREEELAQFADLDLRAFNVAETLPFSTDAAAFVFMNDLTYTKRLIFENFGFGVPTFGFYEGINDDWNLDRVLPRRPYRSTDYLLLPGLYQQGFYADRACRIVGLPNVRGRLAEPFVAPKTRRAIINVNFTYGVLEDRRDDYVRSAVEACRLAGLDYVISQHPADKGDLSAYNVSRESIYALLEAGGVLVSRFSTTLLEALAMGRPAIYHNPIGERVPKFTQPLGAYSLSTDTAQLVAALQRELDFVAADGDVRARAALFLHFHCNTLNPRDPSDLAADAIADVLAAAAPRLAFKKGGPIYESVAPPKGLRQRQVADDAPLRTDSEEVQQTAEAEALRQELAALRANFIALDARAQMLEQAHATGRTAAEAGLAGLRNRMQQDQAERQALIARLRLLLQPVGIPAPAPDPGAMTPQQDDLAPSP